MLNKIDYKIFSKINALGIDNKKQLDAILYSNKFSETRKFLDGKNINYIEFPFISSFAINVNVKQLFNLANQENVRYIASDSKVCSLIYDSKKFMGVSFLESQITKKYKH